MNRDFNRYTVIKNYDLEQAISKGYVSEKDYEALQLILMTLRTMRRAQGKPLLETVVVESDWPEYEPTWKLIEDRVDQEDIRKGIDAAHNNYSETGKISFLKGISKYCQGYNEYMRGVESHKPTQVTPEYVRGAAEAARAFNETGKISFMRGISEYCNGYNASMRELQEKA